MSLLEGATKFTTSLPGVLGGVPILCVLCSDWLLAASSPEYYVRKPTWQETMLASREALVRPESTRAAASRFQAYTSGVIRGGEPAIRISVPVAGQTELFLYVTGVPDPVGGAGTWAEAQLIDRDGKAVRASRLPGLAILEGRHAIDVNLKSGVSGPLAISGRKFTHGIHVYADSKVRLPLESRFVRFEAWIGIDDWVGRRGNVRFEVLDAAGAARHDLWDVVRRDFIEGESRHQMRWEYEDQIWAGDWTPGDYGVLARRYAAAARRVGPLAEEATRLARGACDTEQLKRIRGLYYRSRQLDDATRRAGALNLNALRMVIDDLTKSFGSKYAQGPAFQARLESLEKELRAGLDLGEAQTTVGNALRGVPRTAGEAGTSHLGTPRSAFPTEVLEKIVALLDRFDQLQREALLANPLLDFDRLLVVRREPHCDARRPMDTGYGMGEYLGLPRQSSKCAPGIEEPENWDNEIAVLQPVRPEGRLTTLYKPDGRRDILDVDLHWDADRMLFSMPGTLKKWQVFEIGTDGRGLRQVTPGDQPDVHSYDPCYLPNGKIAFISTAPLQGVPCNAGVIVGMMYLMNADGRNIRQVCFEQDHDHCPTVLHDGRILYLRWDYTDTPHVWNRVLFAMNPDGTGQAEYYGSNSYWPNAIFYARPVPGHSTKVVGIVTGHHVGRVGELVIFDPAKGRRETDGVVQRIPGYGQKVEPVIEDKLTEHSWPKFLHPWPLRASLQISFLHVPGGVT